MKFAGLVLKKVVKNLLIKQLVLSIIISFASFFIGGFLTSIAALYGGMITMVGTLLMSIHVYRAARAAKVGSDQKQQGYIEIYLGVIKKFVGTLALFAFGIAILDLSPGVMVISFIVTQFSYLFNQVDTSYSSVSSSN